MVVIRLFTIVPARVSTMFPRQDRTGGDSDWRFVYNIVMLPLNVLFCFLAFKTHEVPNN